MVATRDLTGLGAAPGVAIGKAAEVGQASLPPPRPISPQEVESEQGRLREAAVAVSRELRALVSRLRDEGHADEAQIFVAAATMARDPSLVDAAAARITTDRVDAATAIVRAGAVVAEQIASLPDELLRARATDVSDVADRIARRLAGLPSEATLSEPSVIVGADLAPAVAATLPHEYILGICLEGSSPTAHAAILARAYGIPAVVQVAGLLGSVRSANGAVELAIDGATGEIVVDPGPEERTRFDRKAGAAASARARDLIEAAAPATTTDGVEVSLLANIGNPAEAEQAVELGARGVGLFRTEFLFLERRSPPSEDEQMAAYKRVVEAFAGQVVTIRLLDVGGDKRIPYLDQPPEENPFLGVRALRLAERHPEIFLTQLRACYRAAAGGRVKVMAPMVADGTDVDLLLSLAEDARRGLVAEGQPIGDLALGVMLEIPSAILVANSYFGRIGFASLGTNDLLQYALAVDRGNAGLERYRDALHPAQLQLIRLAVRAAALAGINLSVCGEMAGDPAAALALVGLGVRSLSMSPPSIPAVRRAIRASSAADLARAAMAACDDHSAAAARARLSSLA